MSLKYATIAGVHIKVLDVLPLDADGDDNKVRSWFSP